MENLSALESILDYQWHETAVKFIYSKAKVRVIITGNQAGKCVRKGSKIQMFSGVLANIENVKRGDVLLSLNEDMKVVPSTVRNLINSGEKECFEIETRLGKKLSVSDIHPFLTIDGWKKISELKDGDYIASPRFLKIDSIGQLEDWKYILLGYIIGDGCIQKSTISISNKDQNIINEIISVLPEGHNLIRNTKEKYDYRIRGKSGNNEALTLIRESGLALAGSYDKFVPDSVMKSSNEKVAMFLSRLYSCDGWVDGKGIGYCSVSRKLIFDIQQLLLRFGIPSRVREKKVKYNGSIRKAFHVEIRKFEFVKKFRDCIGIYSKNEKLDQLINRKEKEFSKDHTDIVPIKINDLIKSMHRAKVSHGNPEYQDRVGYDLLRSSRGKTITREKLKEIADHFRIKRLNDLACSDIIWDEIISIKSVGIHPTYDLEIDGTHNFIANGIFAHNTKTAMLDLAMRELGVHPVRTRNRLDKPVRCVSKCLPKNDEDEENAQYNELKIMYPPDLIVKDVTARSSILTVKTLSGDLNRIEFMSKNMNLDAFMSTQRSALYQDEEIERVKFNESLMRLLRVGGDVVVTLTPVKGLDWTYDELWLKASKIYRSPTICKKFNLPPVTTNSKGKDIEIFCWATDDNPVLSPDDIDRIMEQVGAVDDDELAMRRYGVFKQASGKMYKNFDKTIHQISYDKYFDPDEFSRYWHYRIIDYHPTKPWYVSFVAITPAHERFVWKELILKHDNATTFELRDIILRESLVPEESLLNRKTLIDPLAAVKQSNSGYNVIEDLTRGLDSLHRVETADTKNAQGRMNVKHWIKNSVDCAHPWNNQKRQVADVRFGNYLPTLWIFDSCPGHIEHLQNWRTKDYKTDEAKAAHDEKKIVQKWSDFCRNLEFLGALNPVWYNMDGIEDAQELPWFNRKRA